LRGISNTGKDRELIILFVQAKGMPRKLVAPKSVGDYFERIREATRDYRRQAAEAEGLARQRRSSDPRTGCSPPRPRHTTGPPGHT